MSTVLVTARIRARPETREDLVALLVEVQTASRAEDGCVSYGFFAALEDPDSLIAVEEWRDRASLDAHFGQPHLVRLLQEMPNLIAAPPEIVLHEVAGAQQLPV
jgi:quinol monooxygenase YgiN